MLMQIPIVGEIVFKNWDMRSSLVREENKPRQTEPANLLTSHMQQVEW